MYDFSKYEKMCEEGASQEEIYEEGKTDGLDGFTLANLLHLVCGLPFVAAVGKVKADGLDMGVPKRSPSAPTANKYQFLNLFESALETAARNAEARLGRRIPRNFEIFLQGAGYPGVLLEAEKVFDIIYLGDEEFFAVIDLGVEKVDKQHTTIYMVVSGHDPRPFEKTWNTPPGSGPFKQVNLERISVQEE